MIVLESLTAMRIAGGTSRGGIHLMGTPYRAGLQAVVERAVNVDMAVEAQCAVRLMVEAE